MKQFGVFTILSFLFAGLFQSCTTDVELEGTWRNITVVYGLLDKNEDIHYVLINKAALGPGNALEYATLRDSLEYDPADVNAYIEEVVSGNVVRTFLLKDTTLNNKGADGIFYSGDHTVYYFNEANLDESASYKLYVEIASSGEVILVKGETELVGSFPISQPLKNFPGAPSQPQISFANANSSITDDYPPLGIKWNGPSTADRYEVKITLNYEEVTATSTAMRSIDWELGTISGASNTETNAEGKSFYQWVDAKIKNNPTLNDPSILNRRFKGLDFTIVAAGEDLNTYINVNQPVTGVVQERPEFTNIDNGIGLFSSRTSESVDFKWLDKFSFEELCEGQYTYSLNFCTDSLYYPEVDDQPSTWCP